MTAVPVTNLLDRVEAALNWYRRTGHVAPDPTTGSGAIRLLEAEASLRLRSTCLAVASATSALHVALQIAGARPGCEVVVPGRDWGAARAVAELLGASVVEVDPPAGKRTVRAREVLARIGIGTVAVVVAHHPKERAPAGELASALHPLGITVVEDAADADLAQLLNSDPVGVAGRFGCYSFGTGKAIDAGGGGLLAVNTPRDIEQAIRLTQHPSRQSLLGWADPSGGLNHRIHPIAAIIALHALVGDQGGCSTGLEPAL